MRLIDADSLKARNPMLGTLARWMIDAAPTILVVVRCRDCRWYCKGRCDWLELETEEDFFCADGQEIVR